MFVYVYPVGSIAQPNQVLTGFPITTGMFLICFKMTSNFLISRETRDGKLKLPWLKCLEQHINVIRVREPKLEYTDYKIQTSKEIRVLCQQKGQKSACFERKY